jgi:hypothetical protein
MTALRASLPLVARADARLLSDPVTTLFAVPWAAA